MKFNLYEKRDGESFSHAEVGGGGTKRFGVVST